MPRSIVPFTGAGISTECGIPDFRSPGGIWTKNQPIPFDDFLASQEMRRRSLAAAVCHGGEFRERQTRPRTSRAGQSLPGRQSPALITQNIDNLHQASGFAAADVVELHGNTTYAICLDCAKRYELAWVKEKFETSGGRAPDCGLRRLHQDRDGLVRPGDAGGGDATRRGIDQKLRSVSRHRLLAGGLAGGGFPVGGQTQRRALVIINREPTDFDEIADLVVRNDIGDALAFHHALIRRSLRCAQSCVQAYFAPLPF